MLTNINRLRNKLDEIYLLLQTYHPGVFAITETWLDCSVPDSVILFHDYNIYRKDRSSGLGGGVMFYVDNTFYSKRLICDNVDCSDFEILWIYVRPTLLSRPLGQLIYCVVYCPPWYNISLQNQLCFNIMNTINMLQRKYPHAGFIIAGDFNALDCNVFNRHLCFKQLIRRPTRGKNILDKVFCNYSPFFCDPLIMSPIAKSDHCCIYIRVNNSIDNHNTGYRTVNRRCLNPVTLNSIGLDLHRVRWHDMYSIDNAQKQADFFYNAVDDIVNKHAPIITQRIKNNDKP